METYYITDPLNVQYLLDNAALPALLELLKSDQHNIVADIISTLIYLKNSTAQIDLITPEIIKQMQVLKQSENKVIANLATVFLNDVNETN